MMIGLVYLLHIKYNNLVFKTNNETLSQLLCDVAFLAVNLSVKALRLQKLYLDGL